MANEELENPDNWDWENAEWKPGRDTERRELWRGRGITWSDNMRMTDLKLNGGSDG